MRRAWGAVSSATVVKSRSERVVAVLAAGCLASLALVAPATAVPARALTPRPAASDVTIVDATESAGSSNGKEPSIAVNPANPNQIAITRFNIKWDDGIADKNADLLYSTDGGATWNDKESIPKPPLLKVSANGDACPCDQTIDYDRSGNLYGTFAITSNDTPRDEVVTGSTTDPTKPTSWQWNGDSEHPTQLTNMAGTKADQPWLVINRDTLNADQDKAYVAYDDFTGSPDARVAVSDGTRPVNITVDNRAGTGSSTTTNPGLRLAADPRDGTMYTLYEKVSGNTQPENVTYKLNRSTNAGQIWALDGSIDGMTVASVSTYQDKGSKFGLVNALLGGVDSVAVDPSDGDVYVAYGEAVKDANNRIRVSHLIPDGSGGLKVKSDVVASTTNDAALPAIAVTTDGTVGLLYDTFDGVTADAFPVFTAHLARSTDQGATFTDTALQTFQSPVLPDNNDDSQRILGDYQQLKTVGRTFYGVFAGNTEAIPAANPPIDAIFFKTSSVLNTWDINNPNPDGTIAGSAGTTTLVVHDPSADTTATCASSDTSGSVPSVTGSDGTPIGVINSAGFSSCTLGGFISLTVAPDGFPWNIDVTSQVGSVVSGQITGIGANIAGAGCSARVDGPTGTNDGSVPFTYDNSTGELTIGGGGNLNVSNVNGCLSLIHNGDPAEFSATYILDPAIQINME